MRKLFLLHCLLVIIGPVTFCQQFGGNPPSLKWRQLNTDTARVIFPAGLDTQAQRVANIVHYLAHEKPFSPGDRLYKINIVLQNQSTVGNGYVGLGPYRSEFLLTPDPDNFDQGSLPWVDQLAVHEYRHVMQYNNFRNGLSKALYYLFGQDGLLVGIDAAVPDWFFEGDAVYNETFVTQQGRGRLPFFMNAYPALWKSGKHYSFMKLRNGSLKDYVPNHYNLGYLLVNYGREKYGVDFWQKVTRDASAYKGLFYPFQQAVKRYAGVNYRTFYNAAFDFYKTNLKVTGSQTQETLLTKPTGHYATNYLFPYYAGNDSLIYLKNSYRKIPAFYVKDKTGEHRLRVKDISADDQFSYKNGRIVYAGYETDARWSWRDYSVIKLFDLETGVQKNITHHTKYFTPDISEDGTKIVAVSNSADGKSELHILDAGSGRIIQVIKSGGINVFTDPKFIDDTSLVSAVRLPGGMMSLVNIDLSGGSIERLTPPSFNVSGYPCVSGGYIYFTASYSGNDDVFALRIKDRKLFQVTSDKLGNYYVNVKGDNGIVSHFTADGYQLKQVDLTAGHFTELPSLSSPRYENISGNVSTAVSLGNVPNRKFLSSRYAKSTRLFNFHSWRPYYEDPDFTFSLYGENVLNTFVTELFYHYNQDEKTNGIGFNATYGALFPYLNFGTEYTFDRSDSVDHKNIHWSQLDTKIGLSVPLNFSSGKTYKYLTVGTNYVLRNQFVKNASLNEASSVNFSYLHHFVSWQQTIQAARQHIYPRLGYSFSLNERYAIGSYSGYQFIGRGNLYLPGFHSTHNIVLSGAFQQRDTSAALFSNAFPGARGYANYYLARMWLLSANYHFPVFYPDWGVANVVYLQRVRANLFYDFSRVYFNDRKTSRDLRSVGGELFVDTRWWNQYALTFGIRFSHMLDTRITGALQANVIELILPTSIIPR